MTEIQTNNFDVVFVKREYGKESFYNVLSKHLCSRFLCFGADGKNIPLFEPGLYIVKKGNWDFRYENGGKLTVLAFSVIESACGCVKMFYGTTKNVTDELESLEKEINQKFKKEFLLLKN